MFPLTHTQYLESLHISTVRCFSGYAFAAVVFRSCPKQCGTLTVLLWTEAASDTSMMRCPTHGSSFCTYHLRRIRDETPLSPVTESASCKHFYCVHVTFRVSYACHVLHRCDICLWCRGHQRRTFSSMRPTRCCSLTPFSSLLKTAKEQRATHRLWSMLSSPIS